MWSVLTHTQTHSQTHTQTHTHTEKCTDSARSKLSKSACHKFVNPHDFTNGFAIRMSSDACFKDDSAAWICRLTSGREIDFCNDTRIKLWRLSSRSFRVALSLVIKGSDSSVFLILLVHSKILPVDYMGCAICKGEQIIRVLDD